MEKILEIEGLTGGYTRRQPVIHELSFDVNPGELVGLIGLNGAGKSTTIKHILGLLEPHAGTIKVDGETVKGNLESYREKLSYVPEVPNLYDQLTLAEHLKLTAMAYGVSEADYEARTPDLLKQFRMENKLKWFPSQFSKGMRQKVMIMCAFLARPKLYVVDEPFVGLDPLAIQSFLDLMTAMKREGASILMSTHILSTAEEHCDRFVILSNGKIVASGDMAALRDQLGLPGATLHEIYIAIANSAGDDGR